MNAQISFLVSWCFSASSCLSVLLRRGLMDPALGRHRLAVMTRERACLYPRCIMTLQIESINLRHVILPSLTFALFRMAPIR